MQLLLLNAGKASSLSFSQHKQREKYAMIGHRLKLVIGHHNTQQTWQSHTSRAMS
jgi:hypothetical protein